jgi:hypothetical protein
MHLQNQRKALAAFDRETERLRHRSAPASVPPQPKAGPSKAGPSVPRTTRPSTPTLPPTPTPLPATMGKPKSAAPTMAVQPPAAKVKPTNKQAAPHEMVRPQVAVTPQPAATIPSPKRAKITERRLRPPTDEMARLSVSPRADRVDRPGRRLTSLEEEDANINEARGLKRKREGEEEDQEYNDEEGEDEVVNDEEEEEPKKRKGPTKRGGDEANRRPAKRTGEFYNPPCERCQRTGRGDACERQKDSTACCHCHTMKQRCSRTKTKGKGRKNDEEESSEDEAAAPHKKPPPAKLPPATRSLRQRKASGKSKHLTQCVLRGLIYVITPDSKRSRRDGEGDESAPPVETSAQAERTQPKKKGKAKGMNLLNWGYRD